MNESELLSILEDKIELNPLFKACVSEVCSRNIIIDGVTTLFPPNYYFEHFVTLAKNFLQVSEPHSGLVFRNVRIADYYSSRDELLSQLSQLNFEG